MIALGDVVIIGGGCYGSYYTGQLERARASEAVSYRSLVVVDRDRDCTVATLPAVPDRQVVIADWDEFLDRWLIDPARDQNELMDMIVPSPLMPHLLASWLERQARQRCPARDVSLVPADTPLGTPYDVLHASGVRYVSFADWICPIHCIEPARCPIIKGPRTWEMGEAVAAWTAERSHERPTAGPVLFTCRHVVFGVGMYPAKLAADAVTVLSSVVASVEGGDIVVGSVSACHGAIAILRIGPQ